MVVAERTREYEMVMILSPEATLDEVAATVERVDGLISGGGGAVIDHERWGLKRLAYEIDDFNEGNYVLTKFSLNASGVAELNRALTASEDIVRYLVTRQEFPKPSEESEESDDSQAADETQPSPQAADTAEPSPQAAGEAQPSPQAADTAQPSPQAAGEAGPSSEAEAAPEAAAPAGEAGGAQP